MTLIRRTLAFFLLLVGGLAAVAQTPATLTGFLDLPWESSRTQVVKALQGQKDLKFARTEPNGLVYFGTYQGRPAEVEFVFTGDRFCLGLVALPSDPAEVPDLYRTVARETEARVGAPPAVTTQAPDPVLSRWVFDGGNYILVTVNRQPLQLLVVYANQALAAQVGK
jgi:hypothetical protein